LVLEALLDSHSQSAGADLQDDTISTTQLERLHFKPIVIQPGDALYLEYRGKDFTIDADFASGERTEFDSSPKASYDQWRKGILPLDMFRAALSQRLIRLRATAKNPNQVLIRNIKIIRAGKPIFEFAKLVSYGQPRVKRIQRTAERPLPCKGVNEYPNVATAFSQANLLVPVKSLPETSLTLSAQEITDMNVDYAPVIQPGDFMVFEANRGDFTFYILLSNGREIVSRPLTKEDAEDTSVEWRKGRIRLDYPEALNQRIVRQAAVPLHEDGTPLLFRGVKIDGKRELIYELEKSKAGGPKSKPVEPPMSYPPDPHVMTASVSVGNSWGRQPEADFLAPNLPTFSMNSMLFQSSTDTSDPNHFKFTGAELDSESGLYHMGARYYSPGLGRFVQPDPLYITYARFNDPQQLNLYAYSRNNPTTFSDPSGLDVKLNCEGGQKDCNGALDQFNGRNNAGFKAGLDKNNKLTAHVSKAEYNKLSKAEKALYNAINNASNHATLNVVGNTGQSEFGVHDSKGVNTVDLGNTAMLNAPGNAGGLNAGDAIAHEALDAYYSLFLDAGEADSAASQFYPGLNSPTQNKNTFNATNTKLLGATQYQGITDGRGGERISFQYITPIPAIDLYGKTADRQNDVMHDAGSRVTGVTFEPKKQD
jgi:RHS repeat-associated protein